ncbi:MAG: anti-sigma factor [bacterium]
MAEREIFEMLCAFAAGAMDRKNYVQFKEYVSSGKELPYNDMGELQNIMALIPVILEIEEPKARLKDEVAKKLLSHQKEIKEKLTKEKRKTRVTEESEHTPQAKLTKPEIFNVPIPEPEEIPTDDDIITQVNEYAEPDIENFIEPEKPLPDIPVFSENDFLITEPDTDDSIIHGFEDEKLDFPGPSDLDLNLDIEEDVPAPVEPPKRELKFTTPGEKTPPPKLETTKKDNKEFQFLADDNDVHIHSIEKPQQKTGKPSEKYIRPNVRELQFSGRETMEKPGHDAPYRRPTFDKKPTGDSSAEDKSKLYNPFGTNETTQPSTVYKESNSTDTIKNRTDSELKTTGVSGKRRVHDYEPQDPVGFQSSFKGRLKKSRYENSGGVSKWILFLLVILVLALIGVGVYLFTTNMELSSRLNNMKYEVSDTGSEINKYKTLNAFFENKDVLISNLAGSEAAQNASGKLFISPGAKSALLQIKNMPAIESGKELQVWLIIRGESSSIGVVERSATGEYFQKLDCVLEPDANIDLVRITSEPSGGSSAPTGKTYLYGAVR